MTEPLDFYMSFNIKRLYSFQCKAFTIIYSNSLPLSSGIKNTVANISIT